MALSFEIPATTRDVLGKGASRRLRREANLVPAVLYGADQPPVNLSVHHDFLIKALDHEAFYSHILTVAVEGQKEKQQVILKALQRHPYKPRILHMDLLRISAHEKLNMRIPLHFSGDAESPAVKVDGGVISHLMGDIEVRCLPADLPEYIAVDLSGMVLNQHLHLSELKLPKGVESVLLSHDDDQSVASAHMPRIIEEEPVATPEAEVAPGDVPTTVEGAEGEAAPAEKSDKADKKD